MPRKIHFVVIALLVVHASAWADGFRLDWARENEPHVVIQLTPDQLISVGRERKLTLTQDQRSTLTKFTKKVPLVLGVESLGEPDCSCHISSALWTSTSEVTIWIERLRGDANGSRFYYEVRSKPGHYTANVEGDIFAAGKPVSWSDFEAAVLAKKDGEYVQLSLPPIVPKSFSERLQELRTRKYFGHRL